jgi:hypothetical protein
MSYGLGSQLHGQKLPQWLIDSVSRAGNESERMYFGQEARGNQPAKQPDPTFNFARPRIEPNLPPDLQLAYQRARGNAGVADPYFQQAALNLRPGQDQFQNHYQDYMNPYQHAVTNRIAEEGNRNFEENLLPALEARFVNLGSFGGRRHAEMARRAARDTQKEILANQRLSMHQGFQSAGQLFNQDRMRQLESSRRLSDLGVARQASNSLDTAQLGMQGREQLERGDLQRRLDYDSAQRQHFEPQERLSRHIANLQGIPQQGLAQNYSVWNQPQQREPQMNGWGQFAQGAGSILNARLAHAKSGGYMHPAMYR